MGKEVVYYSQPPVPPTDEPTTKKSKTPLIIALVLVVLVGILVALYFLVWKEDKKQETPSNTNTNTNEKTYAIAYPEWVGHYQNDDYELSMYYENNEYLVVNLSTGGVSAENSNISANIQAWSFNIQADSDTTIHYTNDMSEEQEELTITKTDTGVKVEFSYEDTSKNKVVELTKDTLTNQDWTAAYVQDKKIIVVNNLGDTWLIMYGDTDNPYLLDSYSASLNENGLEVVSEEEVIATIRKQESNIVVTSTEWSAGEYQRQ